MYNIEDIDMEKFMDIRTEYELKTALTAALMKAYMKGFDEGKREGMFINNHLVYKQLGEDHV